jgi:hypothetical protein
MLWFQNQEKDLADIMVALEIVQIGMLPQDPKN